MYLWPYVLLKLTTLCFLFFHLFIALPQQLASHNFCCSSGGSVFIAIWYAEWLYSHVLPDTSVIYNKLISLTTDCLPCHFVSLFSILSIYWHLLVQIWVVKCLHELAFNSTCYCSLITHSCECCGAGRYFLSHYNKFKALFSQNKF